jgi:uncharacterized protein
MRRRDVLIGAGAVLAAGPARACPSHRSFFEASELEVFLPIDPAHDGVRIAQLSDLHLGPSTPPERVRSAVAAINTAGVDLVALTGDLVTRSRRPVSLISELLFGIDAPAIAVLGNHDHWVDAAGVTRELGRVSFEVLHNQNTHITVRNVPLTVVGVDDGYTRHEDVAASFRGAAPRGTRLVLAHTPSTADRLPPSAGLLCLSGHTHGGQIIIPGLTQSLLRSTGEPYMRGLFLVGGNTLYVNRGLGFGAGGMSLRLGSEPELSFFTLRCALEA